MSAAVPESSLGRKNNQAEDITTALSKFKQLTVIARGSTFALKGKSVDVVLTARDLNVRYVVAGSIRRIGERIRASAQLIDGTTGTQIWADRFDRSVEDVFVVQDELTEAITVAVAPQIERTEQAFARRTHPSSLDAWSLLQTGLSTMMKDTSDALRDAEELMLRACALDPDYAAAFAWAAFNRSQRIVFGAAVDATLDVDEAVAWAERAVELDKDDPVCQMAMGRALIAKGRLERALRALHRAVTLNPNFAIASIFLSVAQLLRGEPGIALTHADIAVRLCPSDAWGARAFLTKAAALRMLGRIEESIEAGTIACDLAPAMSIAHAYLAASLGMANQVEEGRAAWCRALEIEPQLTPAGIIERRGNPSALLRDTLQQGWARLGIL
ncbi:MAG: adenylate cyclase [Gammaproteobacteria bacterium]|jgi:adenylate cyclase